MAWAMGEQARLRRGAGADMRVGRWADFGQRAESEAVARLNKKSIFQFHFQ
jgi:hypothetical protein